MQEINLQNAEILRARVIRPRPEASAGKRRSVIRVTDSIARDPPHAGVEVEAVLEVWQRILRMGKGCRSWRLGVGAVLWTGLVLANLVTASLVKSCWSANHPLVAAGTDTSTSAISG